MPQKYPEGFSPDPEGFTPDPVEKPPSAGEMINKVPGVETGKSFLSKAWDFASSPLIPVTEPTMEEWVKSPSSSATRSALSQATSPLAIAGELAGGIGILKGLRGLRSRVPSIAAQAVDEAPKKPLDFDMETGEIFSPGPAIKPMFNPKGVTGQTGIAQAAKLEPPVGTKVTLKQTTPEILLSLRKQGYVPGGVHPDGRPFMVYKDKPIELEDLPLNPAEKTSAMRELYNLPRGLTTSWDISAPLRQGLPLITSKAWWSAWPDMIRSMGPEETYKQIMANIEARPLFTKSTAVDFRGGKWVKKEVPSFAQEAGLAMTDLKSFTTREENLMSTWAEKVPGVKRSNRAYTTFLNKLRADTFESLIKDAERSGLNPKQNMVLAKEIADFVNTATGRGPLRTHLPTLSGGGALKERSLEQAAGILTNTLFSPRLVASRIRMLNPGTYIAADPFVRKQYMKAFLSTAAAWSTVASVASMAGASVNLDSNNADFGKIRIGNTRLDPAGGFQQYLVAASRLMSGGTTSSTSGREYEFGQGFRSPTRKSSTEDFASNKLHPTLKFAYDLWDASEYKPFQVGDRMLQMFIPLVLQDINELAQEDPSLLPLVVPTAMGMGTQTYGKGKPEPAMISPGNDIVFKGGSFFK